MKFLLNQITIKTNISKKNSIEQKEIDMTDIYISSKIKKKYRSIASKHNSQDAFTKRKNEDHNNSFRKPKKLNLQTKKHVI